MRAHLSVRRLALLVLTLVVGTACVPINLLSPRAFDELAVLGTLAEETPPLLLFIRHSATFIALLTGGAAVLAARGSLLDARQRWMLLPLVAFTVPALLASFLSAHPHVSPRALLMPVCIGALLGLEAEDRDWFLDVGRRVALFFVYGSLAAAVVAPSFAVEAPYDQSWLFDFRLHGLAGHANSLAPIALAYFALDHALGRAPGLLGRLHGFAAAAVIVLAQSKTIWLAAIVAAAVVGWTLMPRAKRHVALAASVMIGITVVAATAPFIEAGRILDSPVVVQVSTLTGRTVVWAYTLQAWQENPLFGYGPRLWQSEMRVDFMSVFSWAPGQAHNQLVQSLGEAGVLGLLGTLVWMVLLWRRAHSDARRGNPAALFLTAVLLIRALTETPLASNLYMESFFLHFVTVGLLVLNARSHWPHIAPEVRPGAVPLYPTVPPLSGAHT